MKNKKVAELVERVAKRLQDRDADAGECYTQWSDSLEHTRDYYRESARVSLNDEDLALIDRERELPSFYHNYGQIRRLKEYRQIVSNAGWEAVIPLAETLREIKG